MCSVSGTFSSYNPVLSTEWFQVSRVDYSIEASLSMKIKNPPVVFSIVRSVPRPAQNGVFIRVLKADQ